MNISQKRSNGTRSSTQGIALESSPQKNDESDIKIQPKRAAKNRKISNSPDYSDEEEFKTIDSK